MVRGSGQILSCCCSRRSLLDVDAGRLAEPALRAGAGAGAGASDAALLLLLLLLLLMAVPIVLSGIRRSSSCIIGLVCGARLTGGKNKEAEAEAAPAAAAAREEEEEAEEADEHDVAAAATSTGLVHR